MSSKDISIMELEHDQQRDALGRYMKKPAILSNVIEDTIQTMGRLEIQEIKAWLTGLILKCNRRLNELSFENVIDNLKP